ncbi:MAG: hypothetical protein V3T49_01565, partial [Dehalococcoidia bacterium]
MSTKNKIRNQFLLAALAILAVTTLLAAVGITAASAKSGDKPFKGVMVNIDTPMGLTKSGALIVSIAGEI